METEWHINGNLANSGSDNGFSPGNFNRNDNIFIQENAFESVVCETSSILPRPQCIKTRYMKAVNLYICSASH